MSHDGTLTQRKELVMSSKIGEEFFRDMVDRGRRELGGLLFNDSNVAQPMYPLRGQYGVSKEVESPSLEERESTFEQLHPTAISHDDHGRDDRDKGLERE